MKKFLVIIQTLALAFCLSTIYAVADDGLTSVGTPIYTADDINKLSRSGDSFYLANDIDLSKATGTIYGFSGTLDGKGHSIKNMKQSSLFLSTENATIKNIKFVNVEISEDNNMCALVTLHADNSTFENITAAGEISINNKTDGELVIGGIAGFAMGCTFTNCKTDLDMNIKSQSGGGIYGVAKCWKEDGNSGKTSKLKNCYTNGTITVEVNNVTNSQCVNVMGLCGGGYDGADIVSCGNTGDINVICKGKSYYWINVSGLSENSNSVSKCYNTGNISLTGNLNTKNVYVAGISCYATESVKESYNTGNITVNSGCKTGVALAGVSSFAAQKGIYNSYNTGNIKFTGTASSDSSAAGIVVQGGTLKNCYSTGSVISKNKKIEKSTLASYPDKSSIGNYYIKGKPFASGSYTSKNAKKVSKITAKNCPRLSSKYWVYSKAKGRMILMNNTEK